MSAPAMPRTTVAARPGRLVEQLETTRTAMRRFQWIAGLARTALVVLGVAWALIWADLHWVFGAPARAAMLLALAVFGLTEFERNVLRRLRRYNRAEAAEEVEETFPDLGQRVRTTLEYAEPTPTTAPAEPGLVRALESDTERRTRHIDFHDLVPWSKLRGLALGLAGLTALSAFVLVRVPETRIAVARFFLVPVHYTTLAVKPGNQTIKEGTAVTVETVISGRPVHQARLQHRRAGSQDDWTSIRLGEEKETGAPRALSGAVTGVLKDCRESLDYRVVAGRAESRTYRLRVLHPLVVKELKATIEPPPYTRQAKVEKTEGDFTVIEGSAVQFDITLDRRAGAASLSVREEKADPPKSFFVPLEIHCEKLTGSMARIEKALIYRLVASTPDCSSQDPNPDGTTPTYCASIELDPRDYKIRVRADEAPTIAFVAPAETLAVIATAEVPMQVEARDDFGIAKVGIVYQVGDGPPRTLLLDAPKDQPHAAKPAATLFLEDLKVDYQTGITYHAFVEDNHPTKPRRATTELRYIDIIPFEQAFQLKEGGGACNGQSVTLEELILRQRGNLGRTFAHVGGPAVAREVGERLAAGEKSLAEATEGFTLAMEAKFGPIPSLHDALAAMRVAATALEKPDLPTAFPAEEKALTGLIKARKNLRKLLSEKSSASACRKIDQQQTLKVRRPPPKPADDPKPRLAKDLKELAREERRISAACRNPSASKEGTSGLAERQDRAAETAKQLQKTLQGDEALTGLARDRMDGAAGAVEQGAEALRQKQAERAAEKTGSAADQLERLAEQVEGLRARDAAAKLAKARDLARELAREEKGLSGKLSGKAPGEKKGPSDDQRRLTEGAETLADWLKRFQADAAEESRALSQAIGEATRANPPAEIAESMRRTAAALDSSRPDPAAAARETAEAAERLAALASDLDAARRGFVQPRLDELAAAEKQAAKTRSTLRAVHDDAEKARAEKAVSDLLATMEALKAKSGEGGVSQAADRLDEALRNRLTGWGPTRKTENQAKDDPSAFAAPRAYTEGVQQVLTALQAEIQEIVLRDALMERDEAVPPRYKALVDDYYRVLSEDLR